MGFFLNYRVLIFLGSNLGDNNNFVQRSPLSPPSPSPFYYGRSRLANINYASATVFVFTLRPTRRTSGERTLSRNRRAVLHVAIDFHKYYLSCWRAPGVTRRAVASKTATRAG